MLLSTSAFGQRWKYYRHEVSFGAGSANYFGDIGGSPDASKLLGLKDYRISETRFNAHVGWTYFYTKDFAVRGNLGYAILTASDAKSKLEYRGLSFNSNIIEFSGQAEYFILSEYKRRHAAAVFNRRGMVNATAKYGVYTFAGLGGVYMMPKVSGPVSGGHITNGYSPVNMVFPVGIGARLSLAKRWSIGYEIGARFSTSDYIDGFHTIWSKSPDVYWFTTFYGIYKIKTDRYGYPILFKKGR